MTTQWLTPHPSSAVGCCLGVWPVCWSMDRSCGPGRGCIMLAYSSLLSPWKEHAQVLLPCNMSARDFIWTIPASDSGLEVRGTQAAKSCWYETPDQKTNTCLPLRFYGCLSSIKNQLRSGVPTFWHCDNTVTYKVHTQEQFFWSYQENPHIKKS